MGEPETVVFLPQGGTLVGLYIPGVGAQTVLGIREDRAGQPVSCAVTNEMPVDSFQSNPHRIRHGKPYTEEQS